VGDRAYLSKTGLWQRTGRLSDGPYGTNNQRRTDSGIILLVIVCFFGYWELVIGHCLLISDTRRSHYDHGRNQPRFGTRNPGHGTCFGFFVVGAGGSQLPAPCIRKYLRTAYFMRTEGKYRVSCGKMKRSATHRSREMRKG